ncbi:MAG: hypothetical protein GXN99_01390, partial [Candidatus Nanohaloarchaeota archaeon]|nr:hypothetical protein [Candidatus Nanohaloarchaeota archaeon]
MGLWSSINEKISSLFQKKNFENKNKSLKNDSFTEIKGSFNGSLYDLIKKLETKHKIIELDLERRLLVLENEVENLSSLISSLKDIDAAKEVLENTKEIKEKLRDLEDLKYVEHLEVENLSEKVKQLEAIINEMKEDFDAVEEAIKNLPNLKDAAEIVKNAMSNAENLVNDLQAKISLLESSMVKKEELVELKDSYALLKGRLDVLNKELKELADAVKELSSSSQQINEEEILKKLEVFSSWEKKFKEYEEKLERLNSKVNVIAENLALKEKNTEEFLAKRLEKALRLVEFQIKELEKNYQH